MNWIYKTLRLGRCKRLTIKRFLRAPLRYIRGRRLIIHTLPRRGWMDRDEVLLHASFQLLMDFIECERPDEWINWDSDEGHQHAWTEMTALYDWWKVGRVNRHDPLDSLDFPSFVDYTRDREASRLKYPEYHAAMDESIRLEDLWCKEDQLNLHRLIDIREYMWT